MVRTASHGRTLVSLAIPWACVAVVFVTGARIASAQQRGRGTQRPAAAAPPAPQAPPQVSAAGIRVTGPGFGANGSELRPFNESPGTVVVLAIQAPRGGGIVEIDDHGSKLDVFSDDKGQSLLEEGRVGPFPKVAEDGSAALVEVEVRARPSAGSTSVSVQGSLAMTLAAGSKPVRATAVRLETGQTFKLGTTTMTIGEAKADEDSTKITFGLARSVLNTIREVRFFDAKNTPIESHRSGSGYFNDKATLDYQAKTKDKSVTIEFELWQNPRTIKVPFDVQAGLGVAAGARTAGSGDATAPKTEPPAKPERAPGPPPVISASDGAASVEAVVKQLQTATAAGKAAPLLAVIYPTDRPTYGQGVAMAMAFLPMASMDAPAEGEKVQKDLDAFFDKHKVKPPFMRDPADLFQGVELTMFVADAMVFVKAHAKKGDKDGSTLPVPSGRPEDVKITGDTAVATLSGKEIKFARISGRWFIRLE
jgi:hypothetical protein